MWTVADQIFGKLNAYLLVAIPLFALMAHVMIRGRVVDDLYNTAHTLMRHLPGGLGIATILACTIFAAISGSSVATALTIGAAAIPQMLPLRLPAASTPTAWSRAGGTLGILIPPSGPMILYGVITDASIGELFMAGIVPGLLMAVVFAVWACVVRPGARPRPARTAGDAARDRRGPRAQALWALSLPPFVLGGMYAGVFTATEAAAPAPGSRWLVATRRLPPAGLARHLARRPADAARASAMLFMILAAAACSAMSLTIMRIPQQIVSAVIALRRVADGLPAGGDGLIFVLGMFLETISIILITTPVILPVLTALKIDPVWYGVLLTINLELALITPPVGMNLFTIKAITRRRSAEVVRGVAPYVGLLVAALMLVLLLPGLVLWLPHLLY